MNLYLASAYYRKGFLLEQADKLVRLGHIILSQWLYAEEETSEESKQQWASQDCWDVNSCQVFILDANEKCRASLVELGIAIKSHAHIIIIGELDNLFSYYPGVHHLQNWDELPKLLRELEK